MADSKKVIKKLEEFIEEIDTIKNLGYKDGSNPTEQLHQKISALIQITFPDYKEKLKNLPLSGNLILSTGMTKTEVEKNCENSYQRNLDRWKNNIIGFIEELNLKEEFSASVSTPSKNISDSELRENILRFLEFQYGEDPPVGSKNDLIQISQASSQNQFNRVIRRLEDNDLIKDFGDDCVISNKGLEFLEDLDSSKKELDLPSKVLKKFIDNVDTIDHFYDKLIEEINKSFSYKMYTVSLILIRKLFENLIIDILRKKYKNNIELFQNSKGKYHQFHIILKNTREKVDAGDFESVKKDFVEPLRWISKLRDEGSKSTHSITFDIRSEELSELKDEIERNYNLLARILKLV